MVTDDERREVARRLREKKAECEKRGYPWMCDDLILALGYDHDYEAGDEIFDRLADLIEPTDGFDLDTVQRVCFECMEGCDEPEWTLYTTIHDAIARYKRGESGPTYDRNALLALSDEINDTSCDNHGELSVSLGDIWGWAQAIRDALEVDDA